MQLYAQTLLRRGIGVHVVALEYPFTDRPYAWRGGLSEAYPPALVYPCNGRNRRWLKWRTLARARRCAFEILEKENIDVLHSFWLGWAARVGEKLSFRTGLPHCTTLMGQDVLPENRHLRGLPPERFQRLIALSGFQQTMLEKSAGRRAAHTIPWGIEAEIGNWKLETQEDAGSNFQFPVSNFQLLGVGSLLAVKNWDLWLQTLALAVRARPQLRAALIGDGPERARLEQLSARLGLSEHVHFAGNLPRAEVLARMRKASVLLHTARFEAYGFVFPEAVFCGCQLVSTPVGIAPEIGAALGNTAEVLAELLVSAMDHPRSKEGHAPFNMEDTIAAYLQLYRHLPARP